MCIHPCSVFRHANGAHARLTHPCGGAVGYRRGAPRSGVGPTRHERTDAGAALAGQKGREANTMNAWLRADDGQGLVEYAVIIAVSAIAGIVAMIFLRDQMSHIFSKLGETRPSRTRVDGSPRTARSRWQPTRRPRQQR